MLLLLLSSPLVLLLVLAALVLDGSPAVDRAVSLSPGHVERARRIVDAHRYRVRPGMLASLAVQAEDADVALNYLAHRALGASTRLELADRAARVRFSVPLLGIGLPLYLNGEANLTETGGVPRWQSVRLGDLSVPEPLVAAVAPLVARWLRGNPEFRAVADSLQKVRLSRDGVGAVYRWTGGFREDVQSMVLSDEDRARLHHYQDRLVAITAPADGRPRPLPALLTPLLAEARARAGNPVEENRAAILVATFCALGKSMAQAIPEAAEWARPACPEVQLEGRADLAKHFLVSATIAAYADTVLADAVGLYKELEDARSGSGFSFNDLAADRAGTRFGDRAVRTDDAARGLQQAVAGGLTDGDLMPPWRDLPEFLPEAEFLRRFGGVDGPGYRRLLADIEARLDRLPMLR